MDNRKSQPIGIELVRRGIVSEEDINQALDLQKSNPGKKIGDILYEQHMGDPNLLITAIGDILGEKPMLLSPDDIKINITDYLPIDIAKKNKAIPFEVGGGKIKVCFSNTANQRMLDAMRLLFLNKGLIMERYITFDSRVSHILEAMEAASTEKIDVNADISELVNSIIKNGMEKRASDIHIEPEENTIRVRYRIDVYGEKFVLRLLKKNADVQQIFELGFPNDPSLVEKCFNKRNSIVLIAAPTGEGKTTTLYSIIDFLNRPEINVTTIEDPVEIRIPGLNQIEIDAKTSFSDSLRTVLRQDPDIILVGEIRDKETAEIAMQAGQTGHYVLSTIHTIDSIEVITRLRKIGVSNYDIASTLATSMSQRLVRRVCPKCAVKREYTKEEKDIINGIAKKYGIEYNFNGLYTYDTVGCPYCNNSGFYGRIGIFEILNITDEIKELVIKDESSLEIRKEALKEGYKPLVIDGFNKILSGYTTLKELNSKLVIY